jgi:hypothetical protein
VAAFLAGARADVDERAAALRALQQWKAESIRTRPRRNKNLAEVE